MDSSTHTSGLVVMILTLVIISVSFNGTVHRFLSEGVELNSVNEFEVSFSADTIISGESWDDPFCAKAIIVPQQFVI